MNTKIKKITEEIQYEVELVGRYVEQRKFIIARGQLELAKRNIRELEIILNERSGVK